MLVYSAVANATYYKDFDKANLSSITLCSLSFKGSQSIKVVDLSSAFHFAKFPLQRFGARLFIEVSHFFFSGSFLLTG